MKRITKHDIANFLNSLTPADAAVDFSGTGWILTSMQGEPPLPKTTITLEFAGDNRAGGSSGCNQYSTSYTQIDATNALKFGEAALTRKGCPEPLMAQEQAYLQALAAVTGFHLEGHMLSLTDTNDTTVAEFSYVSQDLAGTSWEVMSYNNGKGGVVSVIIETSITAVFDAQGMVSGSSGCNSYRGAYETDGGAITFGPLAGTRKMCFGEGVMEQEAAYLAALATAATYKISGSKMELRREDGAMVANLRRA